MEDYLEGILVLARTHPRVRIKDLARQARVKAPSVIEALKGLKERGLVRKEHQRGVELTSRGLAVARRVQGKHLVLKSFFTRVLCLEESAAEKEACLAEHGLSTTTVDRLAALFQVLEEAGKEGAPILNRFHEKIGCKEGER